MGKYVDMHIHTFYSDGTMSPKEILEEALAKNITRISITDHNILQGSRELWEAGWQHNIEVISGVELDTLDLGLNFHILGYGFDFEDKKFANFVDKNHRLLEEVNTRLIEKMEADYDNISLEDYLNFTYDRRKGGWKTLYYLIERGIAKNPWDSMNVYKRYNHDNTCVDFLSIQQVCKAIHAAGGKAILAHPGKVLKCDVKEYEEVFEYLISQGIDGIECYYPTHTLEITEKCLEICKKHDLLITSGSDCHGDFSDTLIGQMQTPVEWVKF
jgi:Predicted metal-dependent phosphoesterases (PHP family)